MAKLQQQRLARRFRRERMFQWAGKLAIAFSILCLVGLLGSVLIRSAGAFSVYTLSIPVSQAVKTGLEADVVLDHIQSQAPGLSRQQAEALLSSDFRLQFQSQADGIENKGQLSLVLSDVVNKVLRNQQGAPSLSSDGYAWLQAGLASGAISQRWNRPLFTQGNSSFAISAGLWAALKGSILAVGMAVAIAFPIGLAAAVYLQEFAPVNRWTGLIELNINNLVAVPSILYGLLGLSLYVNGLGMPRAIPLVAGLVLALMMLPVMIITSRAALHAVPDEVRMAAIGVGASPQQVVLHHVLPSAFSRILTGLLLSVAQVLGEAAPLLLIGCVAFFADVPQTLTDPATSLPVQIYMWASSADSGFIEIASAAIVVLLVLLVFVNLAAAMLRFWLDQRG